MDAGDAGGLAERDRRDAGEVVAALVGQVADALEVELGGNGNFFAAAGGLDLGALAMDIAFVLAHDFDLLGDGARQGSVGRGEGGDGGVVHTGAL